MTGHASESSPRTGSSPPEPALRRGGRRRRLTATAIVLGMTAATALILRAMGRIWWCECGEPFLWSGDVWTRHNSQHLADPYTVTHVSHGLIFAMLLAILPPFRRWSVPARLVPAAAVEALWEIVENTPWVIQRYRETTMSLGYTGDTVANSLGDVAAFVLAFLVASRVRWYWSVAFIVATELILLATIRDNLVLNVVMLLFPIDAVRQWQTPGG